MTPEHLEDDTICSRTTAGAQDGRALGATTAHFGLAYGASIALAALAFAAICLAGSGLESGGPLPTTIAVADSALSVAVVLRTAIALVVIAVIARLFGVLANLAGQPAVTGEIVAGIVLGPSVLGAVMPGLRDALLPPEVFAPLRTIADVGVIVFMFMIGLRLDLGRLHGSVRGSLLIAHAGVVVPFVAGSAMALFLFERFAPTGTSFVSFALFMGVALAVTAFPVLARLLRDFRLEGTAIGVIALACAAVDDATAWSLLAVAVGVVTAEIGEAAVVIASTGAVAAIVVLLGRRAASAATREYAAGGRRAPAILPAMLLAAGLVVWFAGALGVSAIFVAFVAGAVVPAEGALARTIDRRLTPAVMLALLPAFFVLAGARTEVGALDGSEWLVCGLLTVAATVAKGGTTFVAARLTGFGGRQSAVLAALMNTRGLMALLVLDAGIELGVISTPLFTMLVLMALATTLATSPALRALGERRVGRDPGRGLVWPS